MGLRRVWILASALAWVSLLPAAVAAPHEPVVFAVGWGDVAEQFFPHPEACVGAPLVERQVALGDGYVFDPDGCGVLPAARLAYHDQDRSGSWTRGDAVYLQRDSADHRVGAGDLRVGGTARDGALVQVGERDEGLTTVPIADPRWDFVDRDGNARWSKADGLYVDKDRNGFLTPGDLQLVSTLQVTPLGTPGMSYPFLATPARVCYVDDDGSADHRDGEPVFLVQDGRCDVVRPGDLRMVPMRHVSAGTVVREADVEFGMLLSELGAAAGAPAVSQGAVVLDLDGSKTLTQGDVWTAKGIKTVDEASASGAALITSGTWGVLDLDASGGPSNGDAFYADLDGDGRVSLGDARLTALFGQPFGSIVSDGDPDAVAALPGVPSTTPDAATPDAAPAQEEKEGSPIGAPLLLVSLIMSYLVFRRRST